MAIWQAATMPTEPKTRAQEVEAEIKALDCLTDWRLIAQSFEPIARTLAAEVDAITAERNRLAAENAELQIARNELSDDLSRMNQLELEAKCHGDLEESHAIMVQVVAERDAELAAANATLNSLREMVPPPENMYYCLRCQEHIVPDYEEHCETCGTYVGGGVIEALQDILYPPKEIPHDHE